MSESTDSDSTYTSVESQQLESQRSNEGIPQVWYRRLSSTSRVEWTKIRDSFCASLRSTLEAILRCFCLPCCILIHALYGRRRYFRQNGIMYLYLFLGVTVILNLISALKIKSEVILTEDIQKEFVISSMALAVILMLYLLKEVFSTAIFPRGSRSTLLRIFYDGGLYIFGFSTFGFSVAVVFDYVSCGQKLNASVSGIKATFTLIQIVFFHCFYRARIPKDTPCIEIILAHLLGTNLALWFWTLCAEAAENPEECIGNTEKYFSPIFVEFLLLGAGLFYQMWKDLSYDGDSQTHESETDPSVAWRRTTTGSRSVHPGPIIGSCFAAIFAVLIIFAHSSSEKQGYHIAYSVGDILLHLAQICACYICQLSLQFHHRDPERYQGNPERFVLDHEDILLYFSQTGMLLWEGFHAYSLILSGLNHVSACVDLVADILAVLEQLIQTVTLVNLRSRQHTDVQCSAWICECLLFLLVTNLTLWFQNSFYIEIAITRPGERYIALQHNELRTIGYIVHPISIFYRFHSSVCCVLAWYIFRTE